MRFDSISPKQAEIFKFMAEPQDALICDGAVRSGKTIMMTIAFVEWAMAKFDGMSFGICGKTVRSAERNIIAPLMGIGSVRKKYVVKYSRSISLMTVTKGDRTNHFYVFGGKDESSYMLIQGITLAGVLFDEVALMPRTFVDQAIARTLSVDDAKLWFNCNPENPSHWFYKEWVCKPDEHNAKRLHFLMDDNPSLTPKALEKAKASFTGVFYDRYVRGLWVIAEGLIYEFDREKHTTSEVPQRGRYFISVDYGTLNPFSAGLWCLSDGVATRIREYYYSGRERGAQLTDEEYYTELEKLAGKLPIECVVVDPSAASFITTIRRHSRFSVRKARNEVLDGIRLVSMLLRAGRIKIHENCEDAIREFGLYAWDDKPDKTEIDRPLKINDHAMDDIRYFCSTVLRRELRGIPELRGMKDDD
jgi:PBSX family phage terminase large subunit